MDTEKVFKQVTHPCDSWAMSAGHGDWSTALSSMKAGHVVAGPLAAVQPASRSAFGFSVFMDTMQREGLHVYVPTGGSVVVVGYKEDFPADLLADQDKQVATMVALMRSP